MATEQQFQLPNGQLLDAQTITNLYLYSQETTPIHNELLNSNLIRPELDFSSVPQGATNFSSILPANADVANIIVDSVPYMAAGPGRFANASQFDLVRAFFGLGSEEMLTENGKNFLDESATLPPGTYTKQRIDDELFQGRLRGFSSSLELRNYRDDLSETDADGNGVSEYAELVYVWNSTAFAIDDNARFVVNPNGTREIQDFVIQPNLFQNPLSRENFDFATANPIVEAGSELLLEPLVDPSNIGRQVFIDFYNRQNLPKHDPDQLFSPGVYRASDFQQDLLAQANNFDPTSVGVIPQVRNQAFKLFEDGVNKFVFNDKPIFYGTVADDVLSARNLVNAQAEFAELNLREVSFSNGLVLLGGQGNDSLKGDAFAFGNFFGGTDDILVGHEQNDSLDGGGGEDIAVYFDSYTDSNGNLNYDIDINTDNEITTITHLNSGIDGTDTLKNIEWAEFKDGQQILETIPFMDMEVMILSLLGREKIGLMVEQILIR